MRASFKEGGKSLKMNNNIPGESQPALQGSGGAPLSSSDEKTWAMIAHLGVVLNLLTVFLGPIVPLIIYVAYKDRSRYVAYQALQALIFQLVWWIGAGVIAFFLTVVGSALSIVLIGLLCFPIAGLIALIPLASLIYGIVGAVQCSQGQDFRYWLIGDWVRGTLLG
jgi:uncharacterized Tic20 family protein